MADGNSSNGGSDAGAESSETKSWVQQTAEALKATTEANAATLKTLTQAIDLGEKGGASLASVVAAAALADAAKAIADEVARQATAVFLVEDRLIAEGDAHYTVVKQRLDLFKDMILSATSGLSGAQVKEMEGREASVAVAVPAVAAEVVGLSAIVLGLLKSDITVAAREVTLSRFALIALLHQHLHGRVKVFLPTMTLIETSALLMQFTQILQARDALERMALEVEYTTLAPTMREIDGLVAGLGDLQTLLHKYVGEGEPAKAERVLALIHSNRERLATLNGDVTWQRLRAKVAAARSLIAAFDAFSATLTATPSGSLLSPLVAAMIREQFHKLEPPPHLLFAEITASGADVVNKSNVSGTQVAFLAGVQVTYVLTTADGAIDASGAITRQHTARYDFKRLEFEY